jgi:hypothetical protein
MVRFLVALIALMFLVFGLSSYTHYSTLGIDNEEVQGNKVLYRYYRLWWPGNGALLIGHGKTLKPYQPQQHYDLIDPASTFFEKPHKQPNPHSFWNRLGFWWIHESQPQQQWIGLPALLPALLLGVLWLGLKHKT